jgi:hypothetical protein
MSVLNHFHLLCLYWYTALCWHQTGPNKTVVLCATHIEQLQTQNHALLSGGHAALEVQADMTTACTVPRSPHFPAPPPARVISIIQVWIAYSLTSMSFSCPSHSSITIIQQKLAFPNTNSRSIRHTNSTDRSHVWKYDSAWCTVMWGMTECRDSKLFLNAVSTVATLSHSSLAASRASLKQKLCI